VKGHEKGRVDSTEGVKRGGNAQAKSEREKGPRQEVAASESKDRMNSKAIRDKGEV
jgi:hypothetical protein